MTAEPTPARRPRAAWLVAAALAAVLVADLAALTLVDEKRGRGRDPSAAPSASPQPSDDAPSSSEPSPLPPDPKEDDDLEGRLLGPEGFERLGDKESRLGSMDVDAFASRFAASPEEADQVRTGLLAVGFEAARGHAWVAGGQVYSCVVVRVATDGGADRLLAASRKEAQGVFRSGTVPGALTYVEEVEGFSVQHGLFVRDRFVYEVTLTTPEPEDDHAVFDELLLGQRNHAERSDP